MNRIRIKICGITRPEDALSAAEAGADAIGLVFYPQSKRAVSIEDANVIIKTLPPFISKVGLFVDASPEFIESVLARVQLDLLQFHGQELESDCIRYSKPYIKAIRMRDQIDVDKVVRDYDKSAGILLDTFVPGVAGGTGQIFNWDQVPHELGKPLILAGGLNPDNVCDAISRVKPYAVDVSGGVELEPGIKDTGKIKRFTQRVWGAS